MSSPPDSLVVALVLLAALMHAGWNALVKAGGDKLAMQTLVGLGGAIAMAPFAFTSPFPDPAALPFGATSVVLHTIYGLVLVRTYQLGDLSQVYPIARGAAPAFVALGAFVAEGEQIAPLGIAALLVVSAGIMSLALLAPPPLPGMRRPPIALALANAALIGTYSVVDGMGVRRTSDAIAYVAWLHVIEGPIFVAVAVALRGRRIVRAVTENWRVGIPGGAVAATAYGIVLWSMRHLPIAHVVAIRETSVIAAAAIGARFLGEPFGRPRMLAAIVVAIGAAALRLAG